MRAGTAEIKAQEIEPAGTGASVITRRKFIIGAGGIAMGAAGFLTDTTASVTRPGTAFGTTVRLTVAAKTEAQANRAIDAGFAELRLVHRAADLFSPTSEISKLNATGHLEGFSVCLGDLLLAADRLNACTSGAFDATVQPLWLLWSRKTTPDRELMAQELRRVGWRHVLLGANAVSLLKGSALTLNGIAQGYAADRVMKAMKQQGVFSASVDTGEAGHYNADGRMAVTHPRSGDVVGWITLNEGFAAASGDYASFFTPDFLHHHIFDPQLGFSPLELSTVVVTAPEGVLADGLATAFMVMGTEKSLACVSGMPNCHALFIDKHGNLTLSPGMEQHFQRV